MARRTIVLPQRGIELFELSHLPKGSPPQIGTPCVSPVEMRNLLEAARCVAAGSQLVGQRLVVNEAIRPRRTNGSLVQIHCLGQTPLDARNLRADQRRTILEVLWTVVRPCPELSFVRRQCLPMLCIRIGARGLAACGARKRRIEVVFRSLQQLDRKRR